jgi:nucleolar protein 56
MGFEKYYDLNLRETKKKIKESVGFNDFIVQAINNIDETNKAINLLAKRLREWYELYNPELSRKIIEHDKFIEEILAGNPKRDSDSMGAEISKEDYQPILELAGEIQALFIFKSRQEAYLDNLMKENCPNIREVAGSLIGARLVALAGDLKRLIMFPSSTVQLLGAEKALFRHMKTGAKSPKYGVIVQHPFVISAPKESKGKAARMLADKILLAAKVDYFKGEFIGERLNKELKEKFK